MMFKWRQRAISCRLNLSSWSSLSLSLSLDYVFISFRYNLFSSLRMYVNSVEVCHVQDYPIYAYVSSKIGSTQQDQQTHMVPSGFIPDDLKKMDTCSDDNKGYLRRK